MKNFWQFVELGKIFKAVSERHHPDLEVLTIIQGRGTVPRKDSGIKISFKEESRENYKRVERGDFIIHLRSFQGGFEMANSEGIVSPAYTVLRNVVPIANGFFKAYFRTHDFIFRDIAKFVEGIRDGKKINYSQITEIKLPFPPLAEQEKIAELFANIDNAIDEQEKKLLNWRELKKGLLRKIFSQEFRFTDENGNFYPDWTEKFIEEVCKIQTGTGNKKDKKDAGEFPFYVRSATVERSDKYIFDGEAVLTAGDGLIGKIFHYINGKFNCHQRVYYMTDFHEVLGKYFYYYFATNFYKRARILTAKTTVDSLRRYMIAEMKIKIPCPEEQKKIGDYFTELDKIISAESKILENMKLMKKGFCQKIFSQEWEFEI